MFSGQKQTNMELHRSAHLGVHHKMFFAVLGIEGLRLSQAAMLENPQPRRSDSSHNNRPSAVRCIRPPEALGFHSFLVSGLNCYYINYS